MRICAFEHGALTPHSARLGDVGVSLCWHPQVHRLQRGLRTTQRHCITDPPSLSIIASQTVSSVLCSTAPPRATPHTAHTHIVLDRLIRAQNCAQPQHVECLHRQAPRALAAGRSSAPFFLLVGHRSPPCSSSSLNEKCVLTDRNTILYRIETPGVVWRRNTWRRMAARVLRTPRGALSAAVAAVRSHARAPAFQLA